MALSAQVLDHSDWFSNPLRFNVFASVSVGVREENSRCFGRFVQICSRSQIREKGGTCERSETGAIGETLVDLVSDQFCSTHTSRLACQNHERRGGWRELEGDLSKIVAIGKKPLHCLFESFPECVFRLKAKEFFGPADI